MQYDAGGFLYQVPLPLFVRKQLTRVSSHALGRGRLCTSDHPIISMPVNEGDELKRHACKL